jgi:hypothetical protein
LYLRGVLVASILLAAGCSGGSSSGQTDPGQTPSTPENQAPVATDDAATVAEDSAIEIAVLANDSDADNDTLSVSVQAEPEHGAAVVTADLAIQYTPTADFSGDDSFHYAIDDGHGGTARALVSLQVSAQPDAPTPTDDAADVAASGSVDIDVLANDDDPDGDALSLSDVTAPLHGSAVVLESGLVRYSPDDGYAGSDQFSYTVRDSSDQTATAQVDVEVGSAPADAFLTALQAAVAGSWLRINENQFQDVWTPLEQRPSTPAYENPAKVIHAWSSMAWDPNRRQLVFWGGGHANYSGNEVYRFDVRSGLWSRASLPSEVRNPLGDNQYFAVDGPRNAPTSAHTYDNQEFLPQIDRFITFGGAKFNGGQEFVLEDGVTVTGPYLWDPAKAGENSVGGTDGSQVDPGRFPNVIGARMWDNRDTVRNRGVGNVRPSGDWVNGTSAYANAAGHDAVLITESPRTGGRLFRYTVNDVSDANSDSWELLGIDSTGYGNQGGGAYDPTRKLYARTAKTAAGWGLVVWNLEQPGPTNRSYFVQPAVGGGPLVLNEHFGMDFDFTRGAFVVWDGGPDVWYITPAGGAGSWTAQQAARNAAGPLPSQQDGAITVNGSTTPPRGVLGKWKYAADYDVFLGVINPTTGDVWVYKPKGWSPP